MGEAARNEASEEEAGHARSVCAVRADLHCHCLPGLDDGPASLDEALALCTALAADGITDAVATPHQLGRYETRITATQIRLAVAQLQAQLDTRRIALKLHPGGDVRIDERLVEFIRGGVVSTIADTGRYLLLELPHEFYLDPQIMLDRLLAAGVTPIITHPERYPFLAPRLSALRQWVKQGTVLQITAGSVVGDFGVGPQAVSYQLISDGLVSVVASDAHGAKRRPPRMTQAFVAIEAQCGLAAAQGLCVLNPTRVLRGEPMVEFASTDASVPAVAGCESMAASAA